MSSTYGKNIRLSIFGQSHSAAIGVVIDGIPAGERFDFDEVLRFMARRAPGGQSFSTARTEADFPEILSGLLPDSAGAETEVSSADASNNRKKIAASASRLSGASLAQTGENGADSGQGPRFYVSCGAPICAVIHNKDTRSKDYGNLLNLPRPSHSDYPAFVKYRGFHDIRGGGHFSGRLTAPLCFAGALCLQMLERRGISIGAHIASIGDIHDETYDPVSVSRTVLRVAGSRSFPVNDKAAGEAMLRQIEAVKLEADSIGGVVECGIAGLPCGVGEPMFDGIENKLAQIVFGIPAVKGVEFGSGFAGAARRGSENNDAFNVRDGKVVTDTNHAGGILGGISTGMPIVFRAAFKPTASIAKPQKTVSLSEMRQEELIIHGRHDPCIVPRAVPCVEAAAAVAVYDLLRDADSLGQMS